MSFTRCSQYKRELYPRMSPHQRVFVIPPLENFTFPDCHGPGVCKSVDSQGIHDECPPCLTTECLDDCILNQTIGCEFSAPTHSFQHSYGLFRPY